MLQIVDGQPRLERVFKAGHLLQMLFEPVQRIDCIRLNQNALRGQLPANGRGGFRRYGLSESGRRRLRPNAVRRRRLLLALRLRIDFTFQRLLPRRVFSRRQDQQLLGMRPELLGRLENPSSALASKRKHAQGAVALRRLTELLQDALDLGDLRRLGANEQPARERVRVDLRRIAGRRRSCASIARGRGEHRTEDGQGVTRIDGPQRDGLEFDRIGAGELADGAIDQGMNFLAGHQRNLIRLRIRRQANVLARKQRLQHVYDRLHVGGANGMGTEDERLAIVHFRGAGAQRLHDSGHNIELFLRAAGEKLASF